MKKEIPNKHIVVNESTHKRLKMLAALKGMNMGEYVAEFVESQPITV